MSVSEFQNKVWELTDTEEYRNLLEKFSQNTTLYEQKDSNEININSCQLTISICPMWEGEISMTATAEHKEHIIYTFHAFCKVVIRYASITAWRDRSRKNKREISLEYLTEEKFCPLGQCDRAHIGRAFHGAFGRL